MKPMLYYLPLEAYEERYTMQLSSPDGWFEMALKKHGVRFVRVEGQQIRNTIKQGVVLDACGRCYWATTQMQALIRLIDEGEVHSGDTIYLEDFWHPGFSSLPYIRHLTGIEYKIYSYAWAQSVDEYDFTHEMRTWMRSFEVGEARSLERVFVASTMLKDLLIDAGITPKNEVEVVGLPFSSEEVKRRVQEPLCEKKLPKTVIFSSRWDVEKRPEFFLHVVDEVLMRDPKFHFIVATSKERQRSNDGKLMNLLNNYLKKYPNNLVLFEGLSKEEYYTLLATSEFQLNTSNQDWVSYTLLEAATFNCIPVYPDFRSFPEVFVNNKQFTYDHQKPHSAADRLISLQGSAQDVSWIVRHHDASVDRIIERMGLLSGS